MINLYGQALYELTNTTEFILRYSGDDEDIIEKDKIIIEWTNEEPSVNLNDVYNLYLDHLEGQLFIANNDYDIDTSIQFNKYFTFNLSPKAQTNEKGDLHIIEYYTNNDELAITEERIYDRSVNDHLKAVDETIIIKYFKKDGTYLENILPKRRLSDYDRDRLDQKARKNTLDLVKKVAVGFLLQNNPVETHEAAIDEAGLMFFNLSAQLSAYEQSVLAPLNYGLNNYQTTEIITTDFIQLIISKINYELYE